MIKRPLNSRFSSALVEGRKVTTIRDSFWPCDVPIMLYNWTGAPYRSKQLDVAAVIVKSVGPIEIHHRVDGQMFYACNNLPGHRMLHETEGFDSRDELDAWFRPLVKPGQTVTKFLMRFRLAPIPSVAEDAARKSKICICGKPMNEGLRPIDVGGPVCFHCFKHRTDVTPFKDFQGSYEEWVKSLPENAEASRSAGDKPPTKPTNE